ncbi:MAG: PH domain-containing protein [Stenotrophomonas sp.]|uniref:PH domain-containing protein n=1 Tax=Stenotrophomonas sp. TaxID=69392 RepID=UPI003D6D632D
MKTANPSPYPKPIKIAASSAITLWWLWGPLLLITSIDPLTRLFAGKPIVEPTLTSLASVLTLPLVGIALTLLYRRRGITLTPQQLEVVSTFYRKQIPLNNLRLDRARVVNFDEYPEFKPGAKSNGFQLPGFRSGHFRTAEGGKGFCLITDNHRVLILPLRDGSVVMVSPDKPRALLDALNQLADNRNRA